MGEPTVVVLSCLDCRTDFTRSTRRGPAPKRCPSCTTRWNRTRNAVYSPGPLPATTTCDTCGRVIEQHPRSARLYCDECARGRQNARSARWLTENAQARSAKWSRKKNRRRAAQCGVEAERFDPRGVFERDGWTCHLCGLQVDAERRYPDPFSPSLDHVIPLSRGGAHRRDNTACSHLTCNVQRNDRLLEENPTVNITATKDSPRTLRHVRTDEEVRCTDQSEYLMLTTTRGYRDVTDERSSSGSSGGSSGSSSSDVPPQSATKDVWVEHAVARGADRQTAEGQSKAELIAAHGA